MTEETEQLYTLIVRSLDEEGANMEARFSGMTEESAQRNMAMNEAEDAIRESHFKFHGRHPHIVGVGLFPYVEDIDGPLGREEENGG